MPQTLTEHGAAEGMAYVVHNVTYGELRPLAGAPADGDNYAYTPLTRSGPPLIPPQWVPIGQYHSLYAEVQTLRERVAELEKLLKQWQGD